jgi:hypothetical protein
MPALSTRRDSGGGAHRQQTFSMEKSALDFRIGDLANRLKLAEKLR